MKLEIHVHIKDNAGDDSPEFRSFLDVFSALGELFGKAQDMAAKSLAHLERSVKAAQDVQQSALILLAGLATRIKQASGDAAKSDALASDLESSTSALAAAVMANTPGAPEDTDTPPGGTDTTPGGAGGTDSATPPPTDTPAPTSGPTTTTGPAAPGEGGTPPAPGEGTAFDSPPAP